MSTIELVSGDAEPAARPFSVFLSYRRHDTGQAAEQIRDRLSTEFGPKAVYLDTRQDPGAEWLVDLRSRGSQASAFLALIGPHWFDEMRVRAGRIDFVRKEVEWALRDWPGHVVPVLIDTAVQDLETLPRSIVALFRFQTVELRIGEMTDGLNKLAAELAVLAAAPGPVRRFERIALRPRTQSGGSATAASSPGAAPAPDDSRYEKVLKDMLAGKLIPVLGQGAPGRPPESDRLAEGLRDRYSDVGADSSDLPEIAQRVWAMNDDDDVTVAIRELLESEREPTDVHWFFARFPRMVRELGRDLYPQMILTTSYDSALERAFDALCEPYDLLVYVPGLSSYVLLPWDERAAGPVAEPIVDPQGKCLRISDNYRLERTMIVKLHGTTGAHVGEVEWSDGYIVTEDHYIDYPPGNLPKRIIEKMLRHRCLFLGYPLSDWNARVLLRRIWPGERTNSFLAVEDAPDLVEVSSWEKVGRSALVSESPCVFARTLETLLEAWPHASVAVPRSG